MMEALIQLIVHYNSHIITHQMTNVSLSTTRVKHSAQVWLHSDKGEAIHVYC